MNPALDTCVLTRVRPTSTLRRVANRLPHYSGTLRIATSREATPANSFHSLPRHAPALAIFVNRDDSRSVYRDVA